MPRGPGKKENYNFDYSRFNGVEKEDQIVRESDADAEPGALPADIIRQMPGELQEAFRLMQIARQTGDSRAQERANELAMRAIQSGGPEVQQRFQQELMRQAADNPEMKKGVEAIFNAAAPTANGAAPAGRTASPSATAKGAENTVNELSGTISNLKEKMEAGQRAADRQLKAMQEQQDELEQLRGPEDFERFMAKQGISPEDLQRAMSGDEEYAKKTFEKMLGRFENPEDVKEVQKLDQVMDSVNSIHRVLSNDAPDSAPPPAPASGDGAAAPAKAKASSGPEQPTPKIPEHRVQYQKDEAGRLQQVELRCELPGVESMAAIELDVSEKYLRLRTLQPAYVVNVGPFPALVDAPAARAKFSKKRQELTLTVPAT